ncbi:MULTISPECIES: lytic transglycosylase domain-containing protein [unclassified Motilimonas]|uniref:lytic transglycosylase domain-containing protein n=1 Tax=Motilimonas TaxID=1914248 RepID=UPI00249D9BD4|nr:MULTISPECIES: lytic transglycosylase domain-containing protein [unclassified Motilimonas]MDO6524904.1 lytic transglycosylase domain-containing protein [Motilimonas sp. 1_MG-2023]
MYRIFLTLTLWLSIYVPTASADVYMWVDSNGTTHFAQKKLNKNYTLLMRTPKQTTPASFGNWTDKPAKRVKIYKVNKKLRQHYHPTIVDIASRHQLEPALLHAVISAESGYNPQAVSRAGAVGMMQLMPGTAKMLGVSNSYDVVQNMEGGAKYLRSLLNQYNNKKLALAAYNAGPGAVKKYNNQIPPYKETQNYVKKVMQYYETYRQNM